MLITEQYRQLNAKLHRDNPNYGSRKRDDVYADVAKLVTDYQCQSVLDYGCGKAEMSRHLPNVINYDPAVEQYSMQPPACDMVACCDVLEHIEPECLDKVLDDINKLAKRLIYLVISLRPASKILADGRNAHLIVKSADWWVATLNSHFPDRQMFILKTGHAEMRVMLLGV